MSENSIFKEIQGFCPDCGSILPTLEETKGVTCYACLKKHPPDVFGSNKVKYTVYFNSKEAYKKNAKEKKKQKANNDSEDGPVVDRKCPMCGNEKMSYATLQLRSADEGQTVFYTCTKCKFKENENS